jgi:Tfp pilus assembly protein PilZ
MKDNKRKFRRIPLPPKIEGVLQQECMIVDLSIGGAFLIPKNPFPIGSVTRLQFSLPLEDAPVISALCRVRWIGKYSAGKSGLGMGVEFSEIGEQDRIAIARYLTKCYAISRKFKKVKTNIYAEVRDGDRRIDGLIRELSEDGAFLETEVLLPLGTSVDIAFTLPDVTFLLEMKGEVISVLRPDSEGLVESLSSGIGIEFLDPDLRTREIVEHFLREQKERI